MSTTLTAATFATPTRYRAASLRQVLGYRLQAGLDGLWRSLQAHAERRAQQHLQALASHYESQQPQLAAELRQLANGAR